ncbi:uncharacterized protein LOC143263569 [Megalopta genalis]|uniref:uncharacterized protein LOC143263569 n=1 Tax=Megalopta genalis TaxID=115081 RepID=UPI003FD53C83
MANIFMGSSEHIIDYISRIKDLKAAILDAAEDVADIPGINELTKSSFIEDASIDTAERLKITGITDGHVETIGSTPITIFGTAAKFHVVPDTFSIPTEGIIGSAFLREGLDICYSKNCIAWNGVEYPFINPAQCLIGARTATCIRKEVAYLGHVITKDGVKPSPDKTRAVAEFPRPKNAKNVREFLGLAGYYRRFIDKFSKISKPLTSLLKRDSRFEWGASQDLAFTTLKEILTTEPLLQYPDFDREFNVTTDASGFAIGGVLSQGEPGKDKPIAYASRLLQGAELNYSTIEKECLAIVYCVQHFRPYIYGRRFKLITDHRPLVWVNSVKDPTSRLLRWRLKLAEYEYQIIYKTGKSNSNADALSRNPVPIHPLSSDSSDSTLFDAVRRTPLTDVTVTNQIKNHSTQPSTSSLPPSIASPLSPNQRTSFSDEDARLPLETTHPPETTSSDEEEIIDNPNTPFSSRRRTLIHTRDRLTMRNDNLVGFVTLDGQPLDIGTADLKVADKLPTINDGTIGRGRISYLGQKRLILLPLKPTLNHATTSDDLIECLRSLYDITTELQLDTISVSKTDLDHVQWSAVQRTLLELFGQSQTQIFVCLNEIIIPDNASRRELIIENHRSAFAGHKGVTKTYRRIREKYFWPTLKREVEEYVKNCLECQTKKLTRVKTRQPMTLTDTPGQAFDKVSLDIVGPLPTTPSGHTYILTGQDLLTKYSVAVPLKNATAIDTANALIEHLICRFGAPKAILTDQGANFMSKLMKAVAKKFKISQFRTTAFRPQSNGSLERSHHVLTEYLKQFINRNNWDEWLACAMLSYNTSVHEGTLFTPHELVFGNLARLPSADSRFTTSDESYSDYLQNLQEKLSGTINQARQNLDGAKARSKKYYDRKINAQTFVTGDRVYILKEPRKGKFDSEYHGPYEVVGVLSETNVQLKIKGKIKTVHINKLKHAPPSARIAFTSAIPSNRPPPRKRFISVAEARSQSSSDNHREMYATQAFALVTVIRVASAIIGYDCGGSSANVTTFSTVDPPTCAMESVNPSNEEAHIQLLQLADFDAAPVVQCRIEIDRTVFYCGMSSHVSIVQNGRQQYLQYISRDACEALLTTGIMSIPPTIQISGLQPNSTSTRSLTLAGTVGPDGSCQGSTYSDPFGTWSQVVVQAIAKITLKTFSAPVKINTQEILLPSGQRCPLNKEFCLDTEDGHTYWRSLPSDQCGVNQYDVLYEGKATRTFNQGSSPVMYTVATQDIAFALTSTAKTNICGYTLIRTEHPKLFILDTNKEGKFKSKSPTPTNNLDIFTYVNAKFVYVEKHLKSQIVSLYQDIVTQRCRLDQQVLRNALTLARVAPAEVAYAITQEAGYIATQAGEAIHIVKCIPVSVSLRKTEDCFNDLPVTYNNQSYFLSPRTHVLIKTSTQRDCSELIPALFKLQGSWYQINPRPTEIRNIPPLKPITQVTWKYVSPSNLANEGIYSQEDLNQLKEHIMFPIERSSIIDSLAQGASGRSFIRDTVQISNLLDEQTLEKIALSTSKRLWSGFLQFGSISAGILGVYILFRTIKLTINMVLNGVELYAAFGWSFRLVAAAWNSATRLCLHLQKDVNTGRDSQECIEQGTPLKQQEKPKPSQITSTREPAPADIGRNYEHSDDDYDTVLNTRITPSVPNRGHTSRFL